MKTRDNKTENRAAWKTQVLAGSSPMGLIEVSGFWFNLSEDGISVSEIPSHEPAP